MEITFCTFIDKDKEVEMLELPPKVFIWYNRADATSTLHFLPCPRMSQFKKDVGARKEGKRRKIGRLKKFFKGRLCQLFPISLCFQC